ncbi:MAG: amidohydrolase family protein, partial [Desulfobacterales bacterium]|nr:amidohydrolase family protein [Desulfobacterales bacterium]
MKRTLIRNGVVVDGGGGPAFKGSLLLSDGRIEAVIKSHGETPEAERVIDAEGLAVSPGFIDMHSHSDWTLLSDRHPEMLSRLVEQGVTTVVGGNCGVSPAPVTSRSMGKLERMSSIVISTPFEYRWSAMAEFLEHVRQTRPIVNMAELVGHATARYMAADAPRGPMTEQELARSLDQVRRAFDEGAAGLSMGLGYDPGMYSPARELEAFCAAAAEAHKPTAVHLKALSKISPCYPLTMLKAHNVQALKEMLDIARKTGVRLQLSHFIFVGRRSWSTADACIRMVEEARRDGVDVMIDAFPYFYGNTTIVAPIPYWFLKGTPGVYRSAMARARLKVELTLAFHLLGFYYKDFQLLDAAVPGWEDLNGLRLPEIAEKWGISPFDALLRLAEKSNGSALILFHTYSGE